MDTPSDDPGRTIIRYSNRKMYDSEGKRHVTAELVAEMAKAGENFRVIGCTDRRDYTAQVLASVLARITRRPNSSISERALLQALRSFRANAPAN